MREAGEEAAARGLGGVLAAAALVAAGLLAAGTSGSGGPGGAAEAAGPGEEARERAREPEARGRPDGSAGPSAEALLPFAPVGAAAERHGPGRAELPEGGRGSGASGGPLPVGPLRAGSEGGGGRRGEAGEAGGAPAARAGTGGGAADGAPGRTRGEAVGPRALPRSGGPHERTGVARLGSVEEQVRHATRARRALAGSRGRDRSRLRARAAEACRAVRVHFPEARAEGAEAAFRAGELWRADEDLARARAEFEAAVELAPRGPFAARAQLELAHLERREGERERALAGYALVLADGEAAPRLRAAAALHAGALQRELGARELARRSWEQVAASAEDPRDRVEAFDLLALDLVAAGDLEGAAGTLARAREELFECSRELTERGEQVRAALSGMRALGELEDAVRRRHEGVRIDGRAARAAE